MKYLTNKNRGILVLKTPKVTIVTITYNLINAQREKTFKQCLESVHNQTYSNIEHLIIDGASTDGTVEILQEYADKGWIKYISEPDSGIYDAMNKGIDKATGEYIAFLNSDDYWHDNSGIERSMLSIQQTNAEYSYAPCNFINKNDKITNVMYPDIGEFFLKMPFSHQTMITSKAALVELGKFNLQYKSAADYDFIVKLILSGHTGVEVPYNFTSFRTSGFCMTNEALSQNESQRIREKLLKSYGCSVEEIEKFQQGLIKQEFIEKLLKNVPINVQEELKKKMKLWPLNEGYFQYTKKSVEQNRVLTQYINIYLFGIKILKIKINEFTKRCYLFGFLPILKIKKIEAKNDI